MRLSTRFQARGLFRIIRGTARSMAGRVMSDRPMAIKGRIDRMAGRFQWRIGRVQGMCGL